jgi:hypothetical protein
LVRFAGGRRQGVEGGDGSSEATNSEAESSVSG